MMLFLFDLVVFQLVLLTKMVIFFIAISAGVSTFTRNTHLVKSRRLIHRRLLAKIDELTLPVDRAPTRMADLAGARLGGREESKSENAFLRYFHSGRSVSRPILRRRPFYFYSTRKL